MRIAFRTGCIILAGAAVLAHAQSGFDQLAWRNIGWGLGDWWLVLVIPIVGLMFGMAAYLIIAHFHRKFREKTVVREMTEKAFTGAVETCDLKTDEVNAIRSLVKHDPMVQPQVIFQSLPFFEKCVHTEMQRLAASGAAKEDIADAELILTAVRRKIGFHYVPVEMPLASTRNIASGQIGSLFSVNGNTTILHRAVVGKNTESYFTVTWDAEHEDPGRLGPGMRVRFAFARQGDGLYGITVPVVSLGRQGAIALGHTIDLKRNQMRQYVRVEAEAPCKVRLVKTANADKSELAVGASLTARMVDISGGGCCFSADKSLRPGDMVSLTFNLAGDAFAGIAGRLIRVSLVQKEGKEPLYRHHIQYLDLPANRQERIIKYVFEKKRILSQWR
jgi:c-di-GMP-binding flagellar brake protein YcgR